jgi:hypothetical protein
MIVNIVVIAFGLSSLVWIFLYPVLIANFFLGEELRSSLAATKILFGAGAVWWVIALVIAFGSKKTNRDDGIREIKKETRDEGIQEIGKESRDDWVRRLENQFSPEGLYFAFIGIVGLIVQIVKQVFDV